MNSKRLMAMTVVGIMIASGFFVFTPSSVSAWRPTHIVLTQEPTNPTQVAKEVFPNSYWDSAYIIETSIFKTGNTFIGWYRNGTGAPGVGTGYIGYETSTNGVTWTKYNLVAGNPLLSLHWEHPYVVHVDTRYYMFVKNSTDGNLYMFNLTTNHTNPVPMNGGNPVYYHNLTSTVWDYTIYNPAVVVVNGTWYMMLESKKGTGGAGFEIGMTYSTFAELNWTAHRKIYAMIGHAGNPYLTYVPARNALLSLYGDLVPGAYWAIHAAWANLSGDVTEIANWNLIDPSIFKISSSTVHIADPDMIVPFSSTYGVAISYGYNQTEIYQTYYSGTLLQFFDQVSGTPRASLLPANVHQYAMLVLLMFGLVVGMQVVGFAMKSKDKGISKDDVIGLSIFLVISLVLFGPLIYILGPV